ncbi:hypothetical protein FW774_17865 [Pedobacter sp. BS3]|uniref:right-handed parallel beta-helix repeat-containing protein n=1 Tax=Pedobacter sp. BS3 TaxID=2567937 RepID=UPI0011ED82C5|nr:right-handed parallel beta-helix repeat-containing protein [Pedobacter sp. BS3]TZF81431.1 hypothetical protein FW774_17865 [Pedobacter sp. BS3]
MKKIVLIIITLPIGLVSCKREALLKQNETFSQNKKKETSQTLATTTYNVTTSTTLNAAFWTNVQSSLQTGPVDVVFANGTYTRTSTVSLGSIGHNTNLLTLKAAGTAGGAVFNGSVAKIFAFTNCKNILMHGLKFTGDVTDYAVTFSNSPNITIDSCYFVDLQSAYYGALGVHYSGSDNVIVKHCTFTRVGVDSHSHMVYGAYGVTRLKLVKNTFTDCSGSFVRFRGDISTEGVVYENTFKSNGTYAGGVNPIFIEIPVFNDVNPGDERFGTSFMITKNIFNFSTSGDQSTRYNVVFHHSGYNPTGRTHLISATDAATLNSGTVTQKRAIMSSDLGLDGDEIRFSGNTNTNVQYNVLYRCQGGYGAVAPWTGIASIGTAVTTAGVATTEAAALAYYDDRH